jgi:hypothetical protein
MKSAAIVFLLAIPAGAETLHYSVNWQSGLSIGEVALSSQTVAPNSARDGGWSFDLTVDAAVPGFAIRDEYKSTADQKFCSDTLERTVAHGSHKSGETDTFHQQDHKLTRESPGNKSESRIGDCAHDALAFLQFIRKELVEGRLAPDQSVYLGGAYNVKLVYTGTESLKQGSERMDADRVHAVIQGPRADLGVDIFFAKDVGRTPVLARLPMALGTFTVELIP